MVKHLRFGKEGTRTYCGRVIANLVLPKLTTDPHDPHLCKICRASHRRGARPW